MFPSTAAPAPRQSLRTALRQAAELTVAFATLESYTLDEVLPSRRPGAPTADAPALGAITNGDLRSAARAAGWPTDETGTPARHLVAVADPPEPPTAAACSLTPDAARPTTAARRPFVVPAFEPARRRSPVLTASVPAASAERSPDGPFDRFADRPTTPRPPADIAAAASLPPGVALPRADHPTDPAAGASQRPPAGRPADPAAPRRLAPAAPGSEHPVDQPAAPQPVTPAAMRARHPATPAPGRPRPSTPPATRADHATHAELPQPTVPAAKHAVALDWSAAARIGRPEPAAAESSCRREPAPPAASERTRRVKPVTAGARRRRGLARPAEQMSLLG